MALRILIVEDEPVIALHLEGIVTDAGHSVVGIGGTMAAALRLAAAHAPVDLAIMDIDLLTKPDGIETARRLRNHHAISSLFVTAHLTDANVARADDVQPIGFIGKPFIDEQILAAIKPFLDSVDTLVRQPVDDMGVAAARAQGYEIGSKPDGNAGRCPWSQADRRRDLRWAWLLGFSEGRMAMNTPAG